MTARLAVGRSRWLAVTAAVAFTSLFVWAWGSAPINLRERIFPKNLAEVEGGWLYRAGQIRPNLIEGTLRELEIDLIIELGELRPNDASQLAEVAAAKKLGIEVQRFPMPGTGMGSVEAYANAITALARAERESKKVLVHCRAGDKRTGGVLAAYQILVQGKSVEDAREELRRFTPPFGRSPSKLALYLDAHLLEIGERLVVAGVIQRLPDPVPTLASL